MVDDAIIAVEMMLVKMGTGLGARPLALPLPARSTAFPLLTGTLVTATGFLPIDIARSCRSAWITGNGAPCQIVAVALVASWFVAVIFTPYIGVKLRLEHRGQPTTTIRTPVIDHIYRISNGMKSVVRRPPHRPTVVARDGRDLHAAHSIVGFGRDTAAVLPAVGTRTGYLRCSCRSTACNIHQSR